MKNIIIATFIFFLPSMAIAQGKITRSETVKPVSSNPVHKHSVSGPKTCKECNILRRKKEQRIAKERRKRQERIAEQQRLEEQQRREEERRLAEERERKAAEEQKRIIDNLINNMVYVEGGMLFMGATPEQGSDSEIFEKPAHIVMLSSYYIGKYEVTQAEWKAVMGNTPFYFKGDNLPVENVSWDDCQTFIRKLNALTGKHFRLPMEAEWEFAARGGNNSKGYKYSGSNDPGSVAWYKDNSSDKTHPVGQKNPNELEIYDMSGNVAEWCQSSYIKYPLSSAYRTSDATSYVYRGGGWFNPLKNSRVSHRLVYNAIEKRGDVGLRLVEGIISQTNHTEEAKLAEQKRIIDNLVNNMVYVSGGKFTMGATRDQLRNYVHCKKDEKPTHRVTLSSYYIGKYEVTQAEWKAVMGCNPSKFKGDNLPVEQVSWNDCQTFIRRLNSLTGKNFRLLTEAEWEFAARGGNNSRDYKYSGSNNIDSVAWYGHNSGGMTHPVGQKSPNELGLYDMTGNVSEWCQDWYGSYSSSSQTNPIGPFSGSTRVLRGGGLEHLFYLLSHFVSSRLLARLKRCVQWIAPCPVGSPSRPPQG